MRRALSISLVLLFWLGPLTAILPVSADDPRLPACCRRHGVHHCTMPLDAATILAATASGKSLLIAPATCPAFPGYGVARTNAPLALAAAPVSLPALLAQLHYPATSRAAARLSQVRTRTGRGPPAYFSA
jgi:hypothetical protein